ncbi:amidase [Demequina zhanjiangensis]|uniref:Amidase n=1 Tax=Demequina zhanjiangensis TaxID=3051659 RepID=A0ABT8G0K4_9MICO|nr:amidase [Demequina sp. SYSU T00b26]MDN4472608.1 amidase [Demequina sp. SYSU T00b26]
MTDTPIHWRTATELREQLGSGEISAVELMESSLDRMDALDGDVNVMAYRMPRSEALALAEEADRKRAAGEDLGPLHGMPIAIKDLVDVAGMPTSRGSRAFDGRGPQAEDVPHVALLREAGALIIGKTNAPEFGVGTVTFNDVHGTTRNPWDLSRHSGGSTGGGAAVAAGMLPFVDGSDSGGSLRYPASFMNIVGLRTSPGVVPAVAGGSSWEPHSVNGPMARNSRDAALLLSGMSGRSALAPLSEFSSATAPMGEVEPSAIRIAWSDDLGLPVSPEVRAALAGARATLEAAGVQIIDVELDFEGVDEAWQTIEMFGWFSLLGDDPIERPEMYRDDVVRNVTEASGYTSSQLRAAFARRYQQFEMFVELLSDVDGFVCPGAPVVAPPADQPWVSEIDGTTFDRYFQWQRMACRLVPGSHPVLAMGAAFADGLPVGIQVVGKSGRDEELLLLGDRLEAILGVSDQHAAL